MKNHDIKLREGIADLLSKVFSNKSVKSAYDKMQQRADTDPEVKQHMDDMKTATDKYIETLTKLCKKYPDKERFCAELKSILAKQGK